MPFKIISVGDYMTGENVHHFGRGIPSKFRNKYRELISEEVIEVISDGDLLFLNFESALAHRKNLSGLPIDKAVYMAPLETLDLLKSLNIPIIANIANNHFAQHGPKVTEYTIEQLEKQGIIVIGKNNQPVKLAINGINFQIWGVSVIKDKSIYSSYFRSSYEDLADTIEYGDKEENEIRIISIHWGKEYNTLEHSKQRDLAQKLSQKGFDIILGHHPHTIQPVSKIDNTWVIYSHGNFLFDQNFSALTQKGLVTRITLPQKEIELFISQQKNFKVVELMKVTVDELRKFCVSNFSVRQPLLMRIKMKLELLTHFYELNYPIIKTFGSRLFKLNRAN